MGKLMSLMKGEVRSESGAWNLLEATHRRLDRGQDSRLVKVPLLEATSLLIWNLASRECHRTLRDTFIHLSTDTTELECIHNWPHLRGHILGLDHEWLGGDC